MMWRWNSNLPTMFRMLDEIKKEWDGIFFQEKNETPKVNLWRGKEGAILTAEMPGVDPTTLDISIVGQTVTLTGKTEEKELNEGENFHRKERKSGNFTKTMELPFRIDADKAQASFENGLLNLTLPQMESEKPKTITVKVS
ncbi:Hsp20/alpha crystallin family protein [bacterium]|nr:Hsp20/alpha crystallin family protein [bacterium]